MINTSSILDLQDLSLYVFFLSTKRKEKSTAGKINISAGSKHVKRSQYITLIEYWQRIISEYYENELEETDKLIWKAENLTCNLPESNGFKTLDFRKIDNPIILKSVQDFCKYQLDKITFPTVGAYLKYIRIFYLWLKGNTDVKNLKGVNRDSIESYYVWLRTQSKFSSTKVNYAILILKIFFDWGVLFQRKDMPTIQLILEKDYTFKKETAPKYLSDSDMKKVVELIPKLPKIEGRMIFCLMYLGVRVSELSYLPINALKQDDSGNFYLDIEQYKTIHEYGKPIPNHIALLIKKEIARNKKTFGDENVKYIFVNKRNKPITRWALNNALRKAVLDNDIRGEDGELLHVSTHYFRAMCATKLIQGGTDPQTAAKLLGHASLSSLSFYLTVTKKETKEYLQPRLDKIDLLIRNMGKISELDTEEFCKRPLCNGYCGKNPLTEPCAKADACLSCSLFIPSIQHLNKYYFELQEVKAAIATYEINGYMMLARRMKQEEHALEEIIAGLEAKRREKRNE